VRGRERRAIAAPPSRCGSERWSVSPFAAGSGQFRGCPASSLLRAQRCRQGGPVLARAVRTYPCTLVHFCARGVFFQKTRVMCFLRELYGAGADRVHGAARRSRGPVRLCGGGGEGGKGSKVAKRANLVGVLTVFAVARAVED
jgi:hypothetical protein